MFREFRDFIARGNVLDLAIAVVIGAAFAKIIDSFVKDILTPLLSPITPGGDFANYKVGPFGVGNFVNNVLQFLVIAFALFLIVKAVNRMKKPAQTTPAVDLAAQNVAQNEKMIALLERLNAKP